MTPLKMPQASVSAEEARVVRWLEHDGAQVKAGEAIVEVETDKAIVELEAPADGLLRAVVETGAVVVVGEALAYITAPGEALPAERARPTGGKRAAAAAPEQTAPPRPRAPPTASARPGVSPAARRLARDQGVDLCAVRGSGPQGRITVSDVERAAAGAGGDAATERAAGPPAGPRTSPRARESVRAGIEQSWRRIPHIHIAAEVAADGIVEARRIARTRFDHPVTVTDHLVFALGRALREVPDLNGTTDDSGQALTAESVNVAIAVATGNGVRAPVVRSAEKLSLGRIALERAGLVEAVRSSTHDKRLFGGATVTLSNLGSYPVDFFAPIIYGPQIALVATGRIAEKPAVVDGSIAAAPRMWIDVALDHRAADGETGACLLAALERTFAALPELIVE